MSEEVKRRGLGRGLSALLGDEPAVSTASDESTPGVRQMAVERLQPGAYQPRRLFDDDRIQDLVESVRSKGVLQPILVRRHPTAADTYEIIAGERRWRAAQLAQLHEVPVLIRDLSDREAAEVALVENLQRQDLSPLEEAEGYRRLMEEFEHTQEGLSKAVGKSRSHVANTMRLLALPDPVKTMLDRGELSAGHARAILASDEPVKLAQQVVAKGLNVRQTEKLVQKPERQKRGQASTAADKDPDTVALERDLAALLGLKVSIKFHGKGGEITLRYGNLEQLDDILHRLSHGSRPPPEALDLADMDAVLQD